jgi:hypothetical protein
MFPAAFIFAHPLVAALGLALWVAFVETGRRGFAWAGFGVLSVSAMLGFAMLTRWLVGGGGRHARGVEQHFPGRVVALHGTVGLGTYVLVLITAIRG